MVYNRDMKNSALNIVFLCVFVAMFVGSLFLIKAQFNVGEVARPDVTPASDSAGASSPLVPVALAEFVNVRGEHWRLPKGKSEFDVAMAADVYPQFVSGSLDPLDVHPGETQKMRVVINSTSALSEVYAEVSHDNGKDIVPLRLVSAGAVSFSSQFEKPFFFDEKGVLTTREEWAASHKDGTASLVQKVSAESLRQYVYEGDWVVHDTSRTTYKTVFFVKDESSRSNHLELAWSDPVCNISATSTALQGACVLSSSADVDGIDGFNMTLTSSSIGYSITISNGATFAYAPGTSITKGNGPGAAIILSGSPKGKIVKQYVYYEDWDADGYPTSTLVRYASSSAGPWTGYIRMSSTTGADKRNPVKDCYENKGDNDLVMSQRSHPGQTLYYWDRGLKPNYDFDCDGVSTETYNNTSNPTNALRNQLAGYRTTGQSNTWACDVMGVSGTGAGCGGQYTATAGSFTCTGTCQQNVCFSAGGMKQSEQNNVARFNILDSLRNFIAPRAEAIPWVPQFGFYDATTFSNYSIVVYELCK